MIRDNSSIVVRNDSLYDGNAVSVKYQRKVNGTQQKRRQ